MMEGALSLMQMAKTTAALHQLSAARQPFIAKGDAAVLPCARDTPPVT